MPGINRDITKQDLSLSRCKCGQPEAPQNEAKVGFVDKRRSREKLDVGFNKVM